jgi:hypothetical protein
MAFDRTRGPSRFRLLALTVAFLLAGEVRADDWKFDVVHLKNGRSVQGMLVKEGLSEVVFKRVNRRPGAPTLVNSDLFRRNEIDHLKLLDAAEREVLAGRLQTLAKERDISEMLRRMLDAAATGAMPAAEEVEMQPAKWGKDGRGLQYESTYFRLASNANKNIVVLAAIHLEQIYEAYARFLPPRCQAGQPTVVLLPQSLADYQSLLKERGHTLLNPAFYDPVRNEIICAVEFQRLYDQQAAVYQKNQDALNRLKEQEAELHKIYKGKVPAALAKQIEDNREQIRQADKQNRTMLEAAAQRLFQTLYHEAFHAYLNNFVYPANQGEIPRWLNEGLAQVFEGAFVDAGELRVERPDRNRLLKALALLRKNELTPLSDLLRSGSKHFLVVHGTDQPASDRHYLTSWAVAYYLAFDRKILGTKELDEYVRSSGRGVETLPAFQALVGQPLPEFEKDLKAYLQQLRPDARGAGSK